MSKYRSKIPHFNLWLSNERYDSEILAGYLENMNYTFTEEEEGC